MARLRFRLTPTLALLALVAFLAAGLTFRVKKGPYVDGPRMLSLEGGRPLVQEPACIETGVIPHGATLAGVLESEGVPAEDARQVLGRLGSFFDLRRVRARGEYRLLSDRSGQLTRFEFHPDESGYFVVERDSLGMRCWKEEEPTDRVYRKVQGTVRGSLYNSMVNQGIPAALVATFCDVFSYDVDFATETDDGDVFEALIEERHRDGRRIGTPRLLGGSYLNAGQRHEAFYFERQPGKGGYYRASGEALKRAFLRSPLNYTRIPSGYPHRRRHPIFKTVRPHLGVDYAAPTGTPVVSVADGTVLSAGWVNGYGKLVRVRHAGGIATYYAHLSRFGRGISAGARVEQNQVIGYVGQTGHATGPHLDFRVEVDGRFVNPLGFKSTGGEPLGPEYREQFAQVTGGYREVLERLEAGRALPEAEFAALIAPAAEAAGPGAAPGPGVTPAPAAPPATTGSTRPATAVPASQGPGAARPH